MFLTLKCTWPFHVLMTLRTATSTLPPFVETCKKKNNKKKNHCLPFKLLNIIDFESISSSVDPNKADK